MSLPKNILVTGGARGIGRCLTRTLLSKGHHVFILDIDSDELSYTTTLYQTQYPSCLDSAICNLRDISSIRTQVTKAAAFFNGKIDVLINNGGIAQPYWKNGNAMDDPDVFAEWQAYMETNLTAPFAVSQACIPYMKTPPPHLPSSSTAAEALDLFSRTAGPCIVHIGSFRALQSDPRQEGYASAKAGLRGLTHSMAVSCKPWGIRVNLVEPGVIRAKHESRMGDEMGLTWEGAVVEADMDIPTNRPGRPEDVVQAVEYLMDAGFMTAQEIVVDGGATRVKRGRNS